MGGHLGAVMTRWLGWGGVSLALHGLLVVGMIPEMRGGDVLLPAPMIQLTRAPEPPRPVPPRTAPPTVSQPALAPPTVSQPAPTPVTSPAVAPPPVRTRVTPPRRTKSPPPRAVAQATSQPAPGVPVQAALPAAPSPALGEQVLAAIQINLERHFHYPAQARRRNWEGRVVLSFRVTPGGGVTSIQVTESSGHELLDQAALTALSRAAAMPMKEFPALEQTLSLRLPVIFQLNQS